MQHLSVCVNNVPTCAWLCVVSTLKWGLWLSQDYVARIRVWVRSKVMNGGLMEALVLATVCDLLGVGFLWDLINRYCLPANKHLLEEKSTHPRKALGPSWALEPNFLSPCSCGGSDHSVLLTRVNCPFRDLCCCHSYSILPSSLLVLILFQSKYRLVL